MWVVEDQDISQLLLESVLKNLCRFTRGSRRECL